ncbi:MAG: diguanylate cyclase [Ruminococcaceae bacterium]|nr:diguanylate cyclase [Oscillospiraceae bacterium]
MLLNMRKCAAGAGDPAHHTPAAAASEREVCGLEETKNTEQRAIPLQTITVVMTAVGFLISLTLMYFMYQTSISYGNSRESTENYIDCQSIATNLLAASDTLTVYARGFVVTGDPQQAELYYTDTQAQNAINEAMAEIRAFSVDERVLSQLDNAMQLRERLMATEDYAMRLKVAAIGGDLSEYPERLRGVQLLPADTLLSPEEQDAKARSFLFDIDYESSKNEISLRINRSMDILMRSMLTRQTESSDRLLSVLHGQQLLTVALMCSWLALAAIIFAMVIAPLRRQISSMSNDQRLSEEGTSEIRFLARTYNRLYEQNRLATEKLNYEATHDGLTGLYNRAAYEAMFNSLTKAEGDLALILLDVDLFKRINDEYGHDIGDAVLKSVADDLRGSFRREDMVCRVGGDEFAVIMSHADSSYKDLVCEKLRKMANKLANPTHDLPVVTLSVGVAFTDQLIPGADLFKSADLALYQVKNGGRDGCGFSYKTGVIEMVSNSEKTAEEAAGEAADE